MMQRCCAALARMRLASLLALTAIMAAPSAGICEQPLKAKVGVLRLSSSAPVFIAQDKGYFRDAGLDIELKFFDAAQPIAVATTSGDIDFGITAFTAGLYNLAGKGTLKVIPLQSLSNAAAALKGETVDAALLPASTARKLMDDGGAKLLGWVGDETPWQLGAVFASTKTLSDKPLVTRLLAALARADREYHDVILAAVSDGKAPINENTRPLLEIIAKYTNLPVEQVVGNCAYIDPDGRLDVNNVDNQIRWLQEQGFVDKGFNAEGIIAKDYVKPD